MTFRGISGIDSLELGLALNNLVLNLTEIARIAQLAEQDTLNIYALNLAFRNGIRNLVGSPTGKSTFSNYKFLSEKFVMPVFMPELRPR